MLQANPQVNNDAARHVLTIVRALGDNQSYWLRKMADELQLKVDSGIQVDASELESILRCFKSDEKIGKP